MIPSCRFVPSCSTYAIEVLNSYALHIAIYKIAIRVLHCNPFHSRNHE